MGDSFTHLHLHTEFSMLDGAARVADVVRKAVEDGQPAIGITDHGNMYGILDFYKACRDQGISPILGCELYQAYEHRTERPAMRGRTDDTGGETDDGRKAYYHLTALAENQTGYRNLIQLSSRAYLEGYYRKPKVDWELLEEHHEGLIVTSGCLGGQVLQALVPGPVMEPERYQRNPKLRDPYDEEQRFRNALEIAGRFQDIFGRDSFFIEIQDHGIGAQQWSNPKLIEIAQRLRAPLLATNDSHYTDRHDAKSHDALLCVQTGSMMSDPDRFKFHGDEHYLKSAAEMRRLFSEVEVACDNTLWIAERCHVEIEFGKPQLPAFPLPEGFDTDAAYLEHLTFEGARERWGDQLPDHVVERLAYELKVIGDMGFSSYFLIVGDLIRHAREHDIRVGPGRGSAAGCAVAYCLRITDLDPIRYDLLFERFLNPSRVSMPDIDMDFDSRFRDEMIRYAAERYGRDRVAQIVTFGTIKARQAVRDAARVLGHPYDVGDRIAKAMPPLVMGRDTPLWACMDEHEKYADGYKMATELRDMYAADPAAKEVIDVARGLEGLRRQDGIHAAAVVITRDPLTDYLPIQRKPEPGQDPELAPVVTQYEMHGVEELGLLKMDFLGLRNLDVITDTLELIRRTRGDDAVPDIDAVPLDDPATFALLQEGQSIGVFQLEGGPMRALMRSLAPDTFDDVAALVALYRPGPMAANMHNDYADRKNGRKPVTYLHDDAEEVLSDTWGLMVYQESMMRVAQRFAGYSLAEADNLRKACLPEGTLVLTRDRGYVPIEQVSRLRDRRVHTIDQTSASSRFEEVAEVWSVGPKPVHRLTTSTGYSIEATADHPLLVEDDWRPLGTIRPGDLVAVAARTHTHGGARITDAEIDLAALLISEGCTPDPAGSRAGHFCHTDPELLDAFRGAFTTHFGYDHRSTSRSGAVVQLRLSRRELRALEGVIGGDGLAAEKRIPMRVVNAPTAKVERFLGLYFCADGWADRSGAHFGSKSREVCLALKRMLLRCGIVANLHARTVRDHGVHWTLSVADKGQAKAFARVVEPHLTEAKRRKVEYWLHEWGELRSASKIGIPASFLAAELERRVPVTGRTKRELGIGTGGYTGSRLLHRSALDGLLYSERLEDLRTGDLAWDTVVAVEEVGVRECFDFRMANDERPYAVIEDFLVHNCGKKVRELIQKEREKFVEGCERTGYGRDLGTQWFDIIEPFADYAFNKSHAYGYGYVAYQTAYLKANYPTEYLAALLTSVKTNLEKAAVYLNECRVMGIEVVVPDINRSESDFTPVIDGDHRRIIFGLSAVRNVGEGLVALIVAEREADGPFRDFYDFCDRVDLNVLNKRTVESLIKAGAFDSLGHPRRGLLTVFERIIDLTVERRRKEAEGQFDLFASLGADAGDAGSQEMREPIPDLEFDKKPRLAFEKEMLGLYVSDHPLMGLEGPLRRRTDCTITEYVEGGEGEIRVVGGVVTALQRKWTKKGDLMAVFVLEDLQTSIEVMVFPKTMGQYGHLLADDVVVGVKARLDNRDDTAKLIAMEIDLLELVTDAAPPVRIRVPPDRLTEPLIDRLKGLLGEHPGESQVFLHLNDRQVVRLSDEYCVDSTNGLLGELRVLLGPEAVLA